MSIVIPDQNAFDAWNHGVGITDNQLGALKDFFGDMMRGVEALGRDYSLAITALRTEYDRACRIERYRQMP